VAGVAAHPFRFDVMDSTLLIQGLPKLHIQHGMTIGLPPPFALPAVHPGV
jgi:hypothetical protein